MGRSRRLVQAGQAGDDRVGDADRQHARVAGDARGPGTGAPRAEPGRAPLAAARGAGATEPAASAPSTAAGSARRSHRRPARRAEAGACGRSPSVRPAPRRRRRRGKPVGGKRRQRAGQRGLDRRPGRLPAGAANRGDRVGEPAGDDRLRGGAGVRRLPGQHLVQHAARARRRRCGRRPPGRPPPARGSCRPACRAPGRRRSAVGVGPVPDQLGDAEVGQQRVAPAEQDVFRLDVPVHDPVPVGAVERVGDLARRCARASGTGSCRSRARRDRSVSPSTYGIVYQSSGAPRVAAAAPLSSTGRMLGCCSRAVSRISRRNRSAPTAAASRGAAP